MNKSHGLSKTRMYRIWMRMKQESKDFKNYFESMRRDVCPEWENDFAAFSSWSYANGYTDTLYLRRRSKFKGYSPDNCYWGPRIGRLYPDDKHLHPYRRDTRSTVTPDTLVNRVFGKLVVLREVPKEMRKPGRRTYVCKCECGNEVNVLAQNLLSGATKSCGCARNRASKITATDTGNFRAGRLTILEQFKDNGVVKYRCLCDCGNMLGVTAADLISGRVTSCGCSVTVNEPVQQEQPVDIDALLSALDDSEQPVQQPTPVQTANPLENWDNF